MRRTTMMAALVVALSACIPLVQDSAVINFPINLDPTAGGRTAVLVGELVKEDQCLRIRPTDSSESVLVRWPYGYGYRDNFGVVEVLDTQGNFVATEGAYLALRGEPIQRSNAQCEGPHFGASSVNPASPPSQLD